MGGPLTSMFWWRGWDLNPRPSGYEPDELPDCSTPRRSSHVSSGLRSLQPARDARLRAGARQGGAGRRRRRRGRGRRRRGGGRARRVGTAQETPGLVDVRDGELVLLLELGQVLV